jgi:hypothetical protein
MIHRTDALIVDAGLSELSFAVNLYLRQHSRRHDRKRIASHSFIFQPRAFLEAIPRHKRSSAFLNGTQSPANVEIATALEVNRKPMIYARHCFPLGRFPDFYERYKSAGSTGATLATYGDLGAIG